MATSGSVSTSKYNNKKWVTLNWSRTSYVNNGSECYSNISFDVYGGGTDSTTWHWTGPVKVWINDYSGNPDFTFIESRVQMYNGTLVGSGSFRVNHNSSSGEGEFSIYIEAAIYTNAINCYGSDSWNLDTLPRQLDWCTIECISRTLDSVTMRWTASHKVSRVQYRFEGGSWVDIVSDANATSGTYTITGLSPNTTYKIYGDYMRRDSELWATDKPSTNATTYDISKLANVPNFNLGSGETVTFNNPSGSTTAIALFANNDTNMIVDYVNVSGNSYTFNFTDTQLDKIYKLMGTSNSTTVRVYLRTKNAYWDYKTCTINLTGNQKTGYVKVSGNYKRTKNWIKINGNWKRCVAWEKVNNVWRRCA